MTGAKKLFAKLIAVMLAMVAGGNAWAQSQADPTFGGLAKLLVCSATSLVLCDADYCVDIGPGQLVQFVLDLSGRKVNENVLGDEWLPIEITNVSHVVRLSYIRLRYKTQQVRSGHPGSYRNVLILLVPDEHAPDGYFVRFGAVDTDLKQTGGVALADREILGGSCTRENGTAPPRAPRPPEPRLGPNAPR